MNGLTDYPAQSPLSNSVFGHPAGDDIMKATADWYRSLAQRALLDIKAYERDIAEAQSKIDDLTRTAERFGLVANRIEVA